MYSCSASKIAWKTSGMNSQIDDLPTLYIYCNVLYESPVAKYRSATSSFSLAGSAALINVSSFCIFGWTCKNSL